MSREQERQIPHFYLAREFRDVGPAAVIRDKNDGEAVSFFRAYVAETQRNMDEVIAVVGDRHGAVVFIKRGIRDPSAAGIERFE